MILLEDLQVYKHPMEIGELVYQVTLKWDFLSKKSFGDQYLREADSIALNISEGYGRFHYRENKIFLLVCQGLSF